MNKLKKITSDKKIILGYLKDNFNYDGVLPSPHVDFISGKITYMINNCDHFNENINDYIIYDELGILMVATYHKYQDGNKEFTFSDGESIYLCDFGSSEILFYMVPDFLKSAVFYKKFLKEYKSAVISLIKKMDIPVNWENAPDNIEKIIHFS